MKKTTAPKEHLYLKIAKGIEHQIAAEVLKVGDKLPSIRMICRQHGVSMSTAQYAFYELEKKALIEPRPQSGYYVSNSFKRKLEIPATSNPVNKLTKEKPRDIFDTISEVSGRSGIISFSRGVPAPELLPVAKLNKELIRAMRQLPGSGTLYEPMHGNENLRRQIARWSFYWKGNLTEEDIVTTGGCINAIAWCLMALTKRGDTIAVESPCFYGILHLAQSMGLHVLELPTSPVTGVDLDALKKIISKYKITACLFVSNFANPLGSLMPDEHKRKAVALLQHYNIPLIEDDLYGDIYFGDKRPTCCKTYDESGIVLLCNSFSKTLAPGYRVGWVAPGKYKEQVERIKMFQTLYSTTITHEVIAGFLENGRYEAHLRKLRHTLHTNFLHFTRVIARSFPEGTKISRPQGGLSVWVELPKQTNVMQLQEEALQNKISFSPGSMFTLQQQYGNCMRLGYGMQWNDKTENGLKMLGKLAKAAL